MSDSSKTVSISSSRSRCSSSNSNYSSIITSSSSTSENGRSRNSDRRTNTKRYRSRSNSRNKGRCEMRRKNSSNDSGRNSSSSNNSSRSSSSSKNGRSSCNNNNNSSRCNSNESSDSGRNSSINNSNRNSRNISKSDNTCVVRSTNHNHSSDNSKFKWILTPDQVQDTQSRKEGVSLEDELIMRQKAASSIQAMGKQLLVSPLYINTAIVYMQRFYVNHSFTELHRLGIATASIFIAAKLEQRQTLEVESVIRAQFAVMRQPFPGVDSRLYRNHVHDLLVNENLLLKTFGTDLSVNLADGHVLRILERLRPSDEVWQKAQSLATSCLTLTTMCVQYTATVIACFCVYLASEWADSEIPVMSQGQYWFENVDHSVTLEILQKMTEDYLAIPNACPIRQKLHSKLMRLEQQQTE